MAVLNRRERERRVNRLRPRLEKLLAEVAGESQAFYLMFSDNATGQCNWLTNMSIANVVQSCREIADRLENGEGIEVGSDQGGGQ